MNGFIIDFFLKNYLYFATAISVLFGIFPQNKISFEGKEAGRIYRFWLNFVGSLSGWLFLYIFIQSFSEGGAEKISFVHIVLVTFGIIGIIGWLPTTLVGIVNSLTGVVKRLIDKI